MCPADGVFQEGSGSGTGRSYSREQGINRMCSSSEEGGWVLHPVLHCFMEGQGLCPLLGLCELCEMYDENWLAISPSKYQEIGCSSLSFDYTCNSGVV